MSKLEHVREATFASEVLQSRLPVVVDFYATWCPPCKMLAPILDRLAGELEGQVRFVKVNVDEEPGLAASHGITGVPTLKIYKDGRARETVVGLLPPEALVSKLEALAAEGPRAAAV